MGIRKRGSSWRAEVCVKGNRDSATFSTKAQAESWVKRRKAQLQDGIVLPSSGYTFADLLDKYAEEVSVKKRGERWESMRINAFRRDKLALVRLDQLAAPHFTDWRERRLKEVSPSTVRREMILLSHACETARKEWHWLDHNPMKDVAKPTSAPHRERIISDEEIELICLALGYQWPNKPHTAEHRVALTFLFALETAMRSGEICGLTKAQIKGNVARLTKTKNGDDRNVPLSKKALQILDLLGPKLFDVTDRSRDAIFRKARDRSGLEGIRFHDTRHTAITALAKQFARKGLSVLDLARMTGHKDLKQLMVYFNPDPADIAAVLD